ncbi:MAG: enoyl-CoA hydratase/isomerase family protein [Roseovarius sp.]|nr:enoyl-CoA hydratase/isomerase family protein [Roseovarius sp.]MCY4206440.1 enoyl-CoA hydratase/isomerase family protein [Roseovarius sp.]MCY4292221.1 enoyl-CoA hydratase/isomerase family protein [Roseovarius sp.]MCY4315164.1 enoyl-CoA hydratase/isomerase family protein [Roseovarius sp.]
MSDETPVLYREETDIAHVTLNAPKRKNSMTAESIGLLAEAWEAFENGSARVAILTGSGGSFCAGLDLETLPDPSPGIPGIGVPITKPVIAAISGPAIGLGLTLTVQADLAIADERAFFQYPEGKIGFTGGLIAGLAARVPAKIAHEIILLGNKVGAERAAQTGLINEVVPTGALAGRAAEMAANIASSAPLVLNSLKAELARAIPASSAETSGLFRARMARIRDSEDREEGLAAFREKRRPLFTGK